jgi:lysozyme family protein
VADFLQAVQITLQHEGGFVDNPADPGGATNMGVEQRDLPHIPIQTLTVAQAETYYQETYWKPLYSQITNQPLASKLFDLGVLFGVGTAVKNLQAALDLEMDGIFGPATLAATNRVVPVVLLSRFVSEMRAHANAVVGGNPKLAVFLNGWLRRISS